MFWELNLDFDNHPVIQASPGEEIEFAFIATPRENMTMVDENDNEIPPQRANNYLILAFLNWQQVDLNRQAYLFIDVEENSRDEQDIDITDLGGFTITAPEDLGTYEFIGILIPNATAAHTHENDPFRKQHRPSDRFIIEVID